MSSSRWMITPSWLSGSWRSFLFSVFMPPLLNIFCFCQVHTVSVFYWASLCMKFSLGIFNFLEEISSLSHSIVFLYFFALFTKKGFLSLLAILWNYAFSWVYPSFSPLPFTYFLFLDNHFAFLHFFSWEWLWSLLPVQCHEPLSTVLQALPQI